MNCKKCGNLLNPTDIFCTKCGEKVGINPSFPESSQNISSQQSNVNLNNNVLGNNTAPSSQNGPFEQVNPFQMSQNMSPQQPNINYQSNNSKLADKKKMLPIFIGIGIVVIALIAGYFVFGQKTLTCSKEQSSFGIDINLEYKIKFKMNKVSKINAKFVYNLNNYADYKDELLKDVEDEYKNGILPGVKMDVKITSDDEKIYIDASANRKDLEAGGYSSKDTYKETKEEFESQGMTCK